MTQYAVVFFANDSDQTMGDAVGPFRSMAAASAAEHIMDVKLHEGACPQVVTLRTLAEVVREFGVEYHDD